MLTKPLMIAAAGIGVMALPTAAVARPSHHHGSPVHGQVAFGFGYAAPYGHGNAYGSGVSPYGYGYGNTYGYGASPYGYGNVYGHGISVYGNGGHRPSLGVMHHPSFSRGHSLSVSHGGGHSGTYGHGGGHGSSRRGH